jgi:hypothetical protein
MPYRDRSRLRQRIRIVLGVAQSNSPYRSYRALPTPPPAPHRTGTSAPALLIFALLHFPMGSMPATTDSPPPNPIPADSRNFGPGTTSLTRGEFSSTTGSQYAQDHLECRRAFHRRAHCHPHHPDHRARPGTPASTTIDRQFPSRLRNPPRLPATRRRALPGRNPDLRIHVPAAKNMPCVRDALFPRQPP